MRQRWADVLRGELESPGETPIAVIEALRKLDRNTALLFERVLQFKCDDWFFCDIDNQFPISIDELDRLVEYGLLLPGRFGQYINVAIGKDGMGRFNCCGIVLLVERVEGEGNPGIPYQRFSSVALSFAKAIAPQHLPNKTYLARIAKFLGTEQMKNSLAIPSTTGKFRLLLSVQSGDHIPIDPSKPDGAVDFHLDDDGKSIQIIKVNDHQ